MAKLNKVVARWLIAVCLLVARGAGRTKAMESKCEVVYEEFPACLEFLVGWTNKVDPLCCWNIAMLNHEAMHGIGAKQICWCIEFMVKGQQYPLLNSRISKLPKACHLQNSFPISESMDCDKGRGSNH